MITYSFITKDNVNIWEGLHHWLLEEFTKKRCRQIHTEGLVVLTGMLAHHNYGLRRHCQKESLKEDGLLKFNSQPITNKPQEIRSTRNRKVSYTAYKTSIMIHYHTITSLFYKTISPNKVLETWLNIDRGELR